MKKTLTLLFSLTLLASCSKKYSPEQFYGTYRGSLMLAITEIPQAPIVISAGTTTDRLKIQIGRVEDELTVTDFKTGAFIFEGTKSDMPRLKSGSGTITPTRLTFSAIEEDNSSHTVSISYLGGKNE